MATPNKKPRVAAIILSWNLKERVIECVGALAGEAALDRIIVVDNGGTDGTPAAVKEAFPEVPLIENGRNLGYAEGNNVGIRWAMEFRTDYVLLINSDVLPEPGSIDALIKAAADEKAGAAGGKALRRDDPQTLDAAWGKINWRNMASRLEGTGAPDGPPYSARRNVDYPLGMALLLSVPALKEVGLFDEKYFAYHEEMELCERLRRAGWPVIFEPARFIHGGSESLRSAGAELGREYLLARNSVRFVMKYGSFLQKTKFWIFVVAASILKIPTEFLRGRLKAHLTRMSGWWNGLLGVKTDESILKKYNLY